MQAQRFRLTQRQFLRSAGIRGQANLPEGYVRAEQIGTVRGWVVAQEAPVTAVCMRSFVDGRLDREACTSMLPSAHIAGRYPDNPGSDHAAFEVPAHYFEPLTRGREMALELWFSCSQSTAPSGLVPVSSMGDSGWHRFSVLGFVRDELEDQAVFVVGSPRSGTTIVGDSLSKVLTGNPFGGEGHFLPLLQELDETVQGYYTRMAGANHADTRLSMVNQELLFDQMGTVIKGHHHAHAVQGWVIEKTPGAGMICTVPLLRQLWPDMKLIFTKRRGLENIRSRIKKFPHVSFEAHCEEWNSTMQAWWHRRGREEDSLEIDQQDILTKPLEAAQSLADYLLLNEHQSSQLGRMFQADRPEHSFAEVGSQVPSLESIGWSQKQQKTFQAICGETMRMYGYSESSSYYHSGCVEQTAC